MPGLARLAASGDLADDPSIPQVMGFGGEWKSTNTMILVEPDGAAALTRPPGQAAPQEDMNQIGKDKTAFELYVRQIGHGEHADQLLRKSIQEWDRAGKPTSSRLHLRALPAEKAYIPAEGEYVLDKPYTKLVVSYLPG